MVDSLPARFTSVVLVMCLSGGAFAPALRAQAGGSSGRSSARSSDAADTATVTGRALSAGDDALPGRIVRLRNLRTNAVLGSATTDPAGRFELAAPRPGAYLVELLDGRGMVIAASELVDLVDRAMVIADVRLSSDKPPAGVIASHKVPRALRIALAAAGAGLAAAAVVGQDSTPVR